MFKFFSLPKSFVKQTGQQQTKILGADCQADKSGRSSEEGRDHHWRSAETQLSVFREEAAAWETGSERQEKSEQACQVVPSRGWDNEWWLGAGMLPPSNLKTWPSYNFSNLEFSSVRWESWRQRWQLRINGISCIETSGREPTSTRAYLYEGKCHPSNGAA